MKRKYTIYIDDSGTKEYAPDPEDYDSPQSGNSRYFVFGGLLGTDDNASKLAESISRCKIETFGTSEVEIKSNWLRIPHERQKRYIEPYNITEAELTKFVDEFYSAVSNANCIFIAAVVDKKQTVEMHGSGAWYAPAIAYEFVLQRVQMELELLNGSCTVIVDDMTGTTRAGRPYKSNLIRQHSLLLEHGSKLINLTFDRIKGPLQFRDSAKSHLIQVADIAAYNVHRQFRDFGEEWEQKGLEQLPTYEHFLRIVHKFRHDEHGQIQGYGVVKYPLIERVRWAINPQ